MNKKAAAGPFAQQQRPARPVVARKTVLCSAHKVGNYVGVLFCPVCGRGGSRLIEPIIIGIIALSQASPLSILAQKVATAGAAALLTLGSLSGAAVAGEFDILAEPTPSAHFWVDDANVLSKSTRGEIDVKLKTLEVKH